MAYEESVAARVRSSLGKRKGLAERRMFGGLAFMLNGNMCCGVIGDHLVLRLGNEAAEKARREPHIAPMDFTGRAIRSMVYVQPAGFATDRTLGRWIDRAVSFAEGLPEK